MSTKITLDLDPRNVTVDSDILRQWKEFSNKFNNLLPYSLETPEFKVRLNQTGRPVGSDQSLEPLMDIRAFVVPASADASICNKYGLLSLDLSIPLMYNTIKPITKPNWDAVSSFSNMGSLFIYAFFDAITPFWDIPGTFITPRELLTVYPDAYDFDIRRQIIETLTGYFSEYNSGLFPFPFNPDDPMANVFIHERYSADSSSLFLDFYIDPLYIGEDFYFQIFFKDSNSVETVILDQLSTVRSVDVSLDLHAGNPLDNPCLI